MYDKCSFKFSASVSKSFRLYIKSCGESTQGITTFTSWPSSALSRKPKSLTIFPECGTVMIIGKTPYSHTTSSFNKTNSARYFTKPCSQLSGRTGKATPESVYHSTWPPRTKVHRKPALIPAGVNERQLWTSKLKQAISSQDFPVQHLKKTSSMLPSDQGFWLSLYGEIWANS